VVLSLVVMFLIIGEGKGDARIPLVMVGPMLGRGSSTKFLWSVVLSPVVLVLRLEGCPENVSENRNYLQLLPTPISAHSFLSISDECSGSAYETVSCPGQEGCLPRGADMACRRNMA